ncbi:MAG: hypothetical protein IT290_05610 [Deltaproteobacteria bacterium]|nr:hypothetical protein [Deltaproteobacteria bacterium]
MAAAFRLFTEVESAKFAGVSVDTVRQYERFGLLASVKKDGELFYRENDLRALFGVREPIPSASAPETPSAPASGPAERSDASSNTQAASAQSSPPPFQAPPQATRTFGSGREYASSASYSAPYQASQSQSHFHAAPQTPPLLTAPHNPPYNQGPPYSLGDQGQSSIQAMSITQPGTPGVYELLEVNRSLREQIQMLRDEREWLRQRVEKFETRTERDQMLLISENDTVKTLIQQVPERRRSFWSFALPWIKSS